VPGEQLAELYAGGMTVRDIGHHLARTLGTQLSEWFNQRSCSDPRLTGLGHRDGWR
jgi:hypothetical protein